MHVITKTNIFNDPSESSVLNDNSVFIFNNQYSEVNFSNIMLDTGAAGVFITGLS
jgi:hypothetical protein